MDLLPIAVEAIADLAHRNPRLAGRWHDGRASQVDIVQVGYGAFAGKTGGHRLPGATTELVPGHGLWVTLDRHVDPLILAVGGQLDASTVQTFRDGIEICVSEHRSTGPLALDLSSLRFVSAIGLQAILDACHRIAALGPLVLIEPPPAVGRLLSDNGMTPLLRVLSGDDWSRPVLVPWTPGSGTRQAPVPAVPTMGEPTAEEHLSTPLAG